MRDRSPTDAIRKTASRVVVLTAIIEAILFVKMLAIADLADPLHVLLLVATAMLFATVGLGLVALGAYCRAWILQAVALLEHRS